MEKLFYNFDDVFVEEKNESKVLDDVRHIVSNGKKVYVVCPLIEGERGNKKSVSR